MLMLLPSVLPLPSLNPLHPKLFPLFLYAGGGSYGGIRVEHLMIFVLFFHRPHGLRQQLQRRQAGLSPSGGKRPPSDRYLPGETIE